MLSKHSNPFWCTLYYLLDQSSHLIHNMETLRIEKQQNETDPIYECIIPGISLMPLMSLFLLKQ